MKVQADRLTIGNLERKQVTPAVILHFNNGGRGDFSFNQGKLSYYKLKVVITYVIIIYIIHLKLAVS